MEDSNHLSCAKSTDRRRFLAATSAAGVAGIAGCTDFLGFGSRDDPYETYGPQETGINEEQVTWDDLGELTGTLKVTTGRTQDQIDPVFEALEEEYPDFTVERDYSDEDAGARNQIIEAGEEAEADVFYTQSSGSLSMIKEEGLAQELPEDVEQAVEEQYRDDDGEWCGVSGRVRAIQYNTTEWDEEELPDDIWEYAEDDRFAEEISTRPNSGTFRSFIIAMLERKGEEETRDWINKMMEDQDVQLHSSGSQQAESVDNDNENTLALGNQYYAQRRIQQYEDDSDIDVTFTSGDAGSLFMVSGVVILEGAETPNLAAEFIRHLLAVDGQEKFVEANGEYPVITEFDDYPEGLPAPEELDPPEFDLNKLSDLQRAIDVLEDEDMTV